MKTMVVEIDPETEDVDVYQETDGEVERLKPLNMPLADVVNIHLKGKKVTGHHEAHAYFTHDSPGCVYYWIHGKLYYICT